MMFQQEPVLEMTSTERLITDIANDRAVTFGPMMDLQVSWLPNGVGGQLLPMEMLSVGYHIVHPERLPAWLIARVDADAQCRSS